MTPDLMEALEALDGKLSKKFTAYDDALTRIQQKMGGNGDLMNAGNGKQSFGGAVVKDAAFAAFQSKQTRHARIEIKNTILGESGSPQDPTNAIVPLQTMPGVVGGAFRTLSFLDYLPRGQASGNTVHYTREASFSNAAAETKEGATKAEATATFEGIDAPVRTIAHWVKASRQVLDDAPAFASYIDARMAHGVRQRLEAQIIAGNGTSPNLSGMGDSGNFTALTVVTADNDFDAASRAKYQVVSADYVPSAFLINPADWRRMEVARSGISGDETPLAGGGGVVSYLAGGMQPMLWGLPVIASNNVTAGTFYCFSRDALMLWERQGATVEMFEQDDTNIQENLVTIRAESRHAFAVFQPAAVIKGAWPDA
jgi:HK97 family phage major capsid protein